MRALAVRGLWNHQLPVLGTGGYEAIIKTALEAARDRTKGGT